MNVASLELCKELYGLSGWQDTELDHNLLTKDVNPDANPDYIRQPLYDLSYLLRRLETIDDGFRYAIFTQNDWKLAWHANRTSATNVMQQTEANTPENAVCKLAIELFKQGVLTT